MAISVDDQADSLALANKLGIEFPLLADPGAALAEAYGVKMPDQALAIPAMLIVLPDRTIFWKYVGENPADRPPEKVMLEQLDAALGR